MHERQVPSEQHPVEAGQHSLDQLAVLAEELVHLPIARSRCSFGKTSGRPIETPPNGSVGARPWLRPKVRVGTFNLGFRRSERLASDFRPLLPGTVQTPPSAPRGVLHPAAQERRIGAHITDRRRRGIRIRRVRQLSGSAGPRGSLRMVRALPSRRRGCVTHIVDGAVIGRWSFGQDDR